METKVNYETKDDVVNLYFALLNKTLDNFKEKEISIKELDDILCRVSDFARFNPEIGNIVGSYEEPDLTIESLKQNNHIKKIENDNLSYIMPMKEAEEIINRNKEMAIIIRNVCAAESFGEDLKEMTKGQIKFNYNNPNITYRIGNIDYYDNKEYNEIFTDGNIKVIYSDVEEQMVEVHDATYSLVTSVNYETGYSGVLTSLRVIPPDQKFLEEEVKLFWNGRNRLNYKEEAKHLYKVRKS